MIRCPRCGGTLLADRLEPQRWTCLNCAREFVYVAGTFWPARQSPDAWERDAMGRRRREGSKR